jgi:energy-coupling factor transporter ATP-binding protein EcfA2
MTVSAGPATTRLPDALQVLRDEVAQAPLGLATPGRDTARRDARAVVDQVDDYLLPRLRDLDAPLLTVVGGSTGAGKSTLVNSIVGASVTTPGVLRPTTRAPVLVCSTADRAYFADERILPGLARTTGADAGPGGLRLEARDDVPAGLALLDAPDVDSVVESNRDLAGQLLSAADLWVFVHDRRPLRRRRSRGTCCAPLPSAAPRSPWSSTGVPPEAAAEIADDLAACSSGPGSTPPGCSSSRSARSSTAACPRTRSPRCATGCAPSPPTRRSGPPWCGRRCPVRWTA